MSAPLTVSETSYSLTALSRSDLDLSAPLSSSALFRQIPGFWVESSGGEAGNNVRSRGIPTDGFSAVAFAENGIPVQYDGALGYLNTDQSFRIDDTVARVEAVRGGPASLFMPNAPGGVANFITRSGLDEQGGRITLTGGDNGYRRIDAWQALRLSEEWGVVAGGFYRRDGGRRPPSYTADSGGQFRLSLDHRSAGNSLLLDLRHMDDRVTFYLPVPLRLDEEGEPEAIAGFDPLRDSLAGPETLKLPLYNGRMPTEFDTSEGTHTRLTALTMRGMLSLGGGSEWHGGLRWRTSETIRNALFPTGTPMTGQSYLASIEDRMKAAFPDTASLALRYALDGTEFPAEAGANGLVTGGNLLAVSVPLDEVLAETKLTTTLEAAGRHDIALGISGAHYAYRFDRYMGTVLLEVADSARLIDAVALDAQGGIAGRYTDGGVQRYGSIFDSARMTVDALAVHASDEWRMSPRLRIDFGARWEVNRIDGQVAGQTTLDLGDPSTLADDQILAPDGTIIPVRRSDSGFGWSIGGSYEMSPDLALFARYTRSFRLPSASNFNTTPLRTDQKTVPITMAELGANYTGDTFDLSATAFATHFQRLPFSDFRFDFATNAYVEQTEIADTRTFGAELEAFWNPAGPFEVTVQATLQDGRYRNFSFTQVMDGEPVHRVFSGNRLIRVPRMAVRAVPAIALIEDRLRIELTGEYFSRRFGDIANEQALPAYLLVGLNLRALLSDRISLRAHVTNLTDTLGLTEGNPRNGSFDAGSSTGEYFFARPEFARTVRLEMAFEF
ncbi:TonB-dependent receptor [Pelagerythrobacter marensis]|uniref:TonB-dependent receptor n=1 Tax=Pelagerythrobacter marensis TaxID=543877 RepID=UPI00136583DF|nr:TonB-dependent receptor [Pelagerythrobacter marensis]